MAGLFAEILETKRREVTELKRSGAQAVLKRQALSIPLPPSFHDALRVPRHNFAVIGEMKRRSPSTGTINENLDAGRLAKAYEELGLSAVSVSTDATYFGGSPQDLLAAAQSTVLPVLCKDFIIDPIQIYQARAFGAAAILLVCGILTDEHFRGLIRVARELSLDILVETHNAAEIERALRTGVRIIGVNAHDVDTQEVNSAAAPRLVHNLPESVVRVAESGIDSNESILALHEAGYDAFVVGNYLAGATDLGAAVAELLGERTDE